MIVLSSKARYRKNLVSFDDLLRTPMGISGVIRFRVKLVRMKRLDVKSVRRPDLLSRGVPRNIEDVIVIAHRRIRDKTISIGDQ